MKSDEQDKPKSRLEDLDVFEVSFVPKAANKRKYLMFKADSGTAPASTIVINDGNDPITHEEELDMNESIQKALEGDLQDAEKLSATFKEAKVSENGTEALMAIVKILTALKEDLPDADQIPVLLGYPLPKPVEVEKIVEKIVEVDKKVDPEKTEEVKKAEMLASVTDETARADIAKLIEDRKALAEKQVELEMTMKADKDAQEAKEAVEKAAIDYPNLPEKADKVGPAMLAIKKAASEDQYALIDRLLKSADEAIAKAKVELGGPGDTSPSGDTYAKLAVEAAELVKKGEYKTTAAAITALVTNDPSKYDSYTQES